MGAWIGDTRVPFHVDRCIRLYDEETDAINGKDGSIKALAGVPYFSLYTGTNTCAFSYVF